MSRPLRVEFAGALYHITARGNERRDVFFCDDDRFEFLNILEQVCERFNWLCHAYCLMGNHYHLLIEKLDGNFAKGMRQLNGVYTQHGEIGVRTQILLKYSST
jgi:putative transposase